MTELERIQYNIAVKTLRMPKPIADVMGGMTQEEAARIVVAAHAKARDLRGGDS